MSKKHQEEKMSLKEQRIWFTSVPIQTGFDLSSRRVALMNAESKNKGPTVLLTAVVHGDELGGATIIHELFDYLRRYPLKRGTVRAFPLLNPFGLESASRHILMPGQDLNRSFPGNPHGSLSERIAHMVFQKITESRPVLVLDLHNDWRLSVPYALIDVFHGVTQYRRTRKKVERFAKASGLLVIEDQKSKMHELVTVSGSLMRVGIPALTLELGESSIANEENVRDGVRAIWNVLNELGMTSRDLDFPMHFAPPAEYNEKVLKYYEEPKSEKGGFIRYPVKPGTIVRKGEPFAVIRNEFGKVKETLRAKADGIVIALRDPAVSHPGIAVVAFGIFME